jgi:hypothetical protein
MAVSAARGIFGRATVATAPSPAPPDKALIKHLQFVIAKPITSLAIWPSYCPWSWRDPKK